MLRFEWEANKNRSNVAKHKVSFETAIAVFDDQHALSIQDRMVDGEERWQTLGMIDEIVLIVAHTWRDEEGDEVIRVISTRKATPTERRAYAENQRRTNQ
jgi:uncharacterized protein